MSLLSLLSSQAIRRGLHDPQAELDAAAVFALVRDMPYRRASDRRPETIITEWQGTCSGKHYLLQALYAELGLPARVMACTAVTPVAPERVPENLQELYQAANRRFVDVHNYLTVLLPSGGEMVVDATWPLAKRQSGFTVNETFVLGQDQQIAVQPLAAWPIPLDEDPQEFKEALLRQHFTPAELEFRETVIQALAQA